MSGRRLIDVMHGMLPGWELYFGDLLYAVRWDHFVQPNIIKPNAAKVNRRAYPFFPKEFRCKDGIRLVTLSWLDGWSRRDGLPLPTFGLQYRGPLPLGPFHGAPPCPVISAPPHWPLSQSDPFLYVCHQFLQPWAVAHRFSDGLPRLLWSFGLWLTNCPALTC